MTTTDEAALTQLNYLTEELQKHGVDASQLVVFGVGSETLIGGGDWVFKNITYVLEDRGYLPVKNPMRILKMSQVSGGQVLLDYAVVQYDLIEKGEINIVPHSWYLISAQSVATAIKYYKAILTYFEGLQIRKAEGVGLVVPKKPSPFAKD